MSLSHANERINDGAPFPWKLYHMLEDVERRGMNDIVSWESGGRCFKVHQKQRFEHEIIPHYFNQTKYKSFLRQVRVVYVVALL